MKNALMLAACVMAVICLILHGIKKDAAMLQYAMLNLLCMILLQGVKDKREL